LLFMYGATYIKLRFDASDDEEFISLTGPTVRMSTDKYRQYLRPVAKKLFFYPVVYTTLVLPMTIVRLAILSGAPVPSSAIIFAAICDASVGFANTVVYVTTRNVGPSVNWEGLRAASANLLVRSPGPEPRSILRSHMSMSDRLDEKVGSIYSIGEPKLVSTTNSSEVRVGFSSPKLKPSPAAKPAVVRFASEAPPTFRALPPLPPSSIYSSESSPTIRPEEAYSVTTTPKSGAADSVTKWRERQAAYSPASTGFTGSPRPRHLPISPKMTPTRHFRGAHSVSSIGSFDRAPTPLIRRPSPNPSTLMRYGTSEDGSTIIESYFEVPDALRPRVPPVARSDGVNTPSNDWSFHSQNSLISHIRALSDLSHGSSIARTGSAASNPIVPPGMGGNLPFALYPGGDRTTPRNALGLEGVPQDILPETAEVTFTPSTAATEWKSPKTLHVASSNTRF